MRRSLRFAWPLLALGLVACAETDDDTLRVARQPLEAYCQIDVEGTGVVDIETDYLPHVIACENGNADYGALQMQAVSARSYAYYRLDTGDGTIADGTSDQVYGCSREPSELHYLAAESTRGIVLQYQGVNIAGFFVAGAIPSADDCVAIDGDNDYSNTERYITYNWGLSGDEIVQTPLGWVNIGNLKNRGCMSQNGSDCLSEAGWAWQDIARFYYGMDIELVQTRGECVGPVEPDPWCTALDDALEAGIIDRGCDGYHEADTFNRAGWSALLARALRLDETDAYAQCVLPYVDVAADADYARAAAALAALTYGDDVAPLSEGPTLIPYGVPDHCEAVDMIAEAFAIAPASEVLGFDDWAEIPEACRGPLAGLVDAGILDASGSFAPTARTRAWEAAAWVVAAMTDAETPPSEAAFTDPSCHGAVVACEPIGATACADNAVLTCVANATGGTEWSAPAPCDAGTTCVDGVCEPESTDDVGIPDAGSDTGTADVGVDASGSADSGAEVGEAASEIPLYSTATSHTGACALTDARRPSVGLFGWGLAMWILRRRRAKLVASAPSK